MCDVMGGTSVENLYVCLARHGQCARDMNCCTLGCFSICLFLVGASRWGIAHASAEEVRSVRPRL